MTLILLIGAQAVGKMTVGKELEKRIDAKLLFNHQTIDLFANFLGYTEEAFRLSDETRKNLFNAFVKNKKKNLTQTIIFTVLINFDSKEDVAFLQEITAIFLTADEPVYCIELVAAIDERLKRNKQEERLAAKPSKRNLEFSEKELLLSNSRYRLESREDELPLLLKKIPTLKIDTTHLASSDTAERIVNYFDLHKHTRH